jgi:hypothetical protein
VEIPAPSSTSAAGAKHVSPARERWVKKAKEAERRRRDTPNQHSGLDPFIVRFSTDNSALALFLKILIL